MPRRPILCYITDRKAFAGNESARRARLLENIAEAARAAVAYIQLRETDLSARELESLAQEAIRIIRDESRLRIDKSNLRSGDLNPKSILLINSRIDVALAVNADGVQLRSDDLFPGNVRHIWSCGAGTPARESHRSEPIIGVSCHSPSDAVRAATNGANFAVFGPVFEKKDAPGSLPAGLESLREACRADIPVLALGGITVNNARSCLDAGAAGIAAIRLFQENEVADVVRILRSPVSSASHPS
jgi:thiamine-phosphate pyrophosphorylase